MKVELAGGSSLECSNFSFDDDASAEDPERLGAGALQMRGQP
jgi:hypothetical protein